MSPVEKGGSHAGRALAVSGVAIAVVALVLWAGAVFTNRQSALDVRLGDTTFQGGNAERLAAEIDDRGPILYGDISDRDQSRHEVRDLILQHLGDDVDEGWIAFRAQPPGEARSCTWEWQPDEQIFRALCDRSLTAPADAEGLEQYPVTVEDGKLDVDLNFADRPTTTVAPSTSSSVIESGDVPTTTR